MGAFEEILEKFAKENNISFGEAEYGEIGLLVDKRSILILVEFEDVVVELGSDRNDKRIMRKLSKKYKLDYIMRRYDQVTAPEWMFAFLMETPEKFKEFLNDFLVLRQEYPSDDYPENQEKSPIFVYAMEEKNRTWNSQEQEVLVYIMEKEDWEHFRKYLYEYYHDKRMKPIEEAIELVKGKGASYCGFWSSLSLDETKEILENHPNFEFNADFQKQIDQKSRLNEQT